VRDYPKVTVYMDPERKEILRALSELIGRPASGILQTAFDEHLDRLSDEIWEAVEVVVRTKRQVRGDGA